jgi:hypothetical protein
MSQLSKTFRPIVEILEARWLPTISFAGQQTFAVGFPSSVAVGDFNGDGRLDLAVTNAGGDNTVTVLLNTTVAGASTASFAVQKTFAVDSPSSLAVGDFNGDGRPDLVVADAGSNTVSVLLNTTPANATTPSFAVQKTFAVGTYPMSVAVVDVNGDGRPDIAVANQGDKTVSVLLNMTPVNASTPAFAAQQTFACGADPLSVAVGDLNGDGRPDIAVACEGEPLSLLVNTTPAGASAASFAPQQTFAVGGLAWAVAMGDLNGDGRPDLAVANFLSKSVSVLLNLTAAGATTLAFSTQQTFAVGVNPEAVAVGDFDGDSRPDLVVANWNDNTLSVLVNTTSAGATTPSFVVQQTFAVGKQPGSVVVGDFDGDGRPDLVTANANSSTVSILLNTTSPFSITAPVVVGQRGAQGVWQFNRTTNTWVQLTLANASLLASDPQGDVVGEFPGNGVWEYRPATGWKQINGVDATALVMDTTGSVAAEFPGYGVGEYSPASGWRSLTGANASLLAVDVNGDVAGEFPGYGVWEFRPASGWKQINGVDVTLLAMNALSDVVANFHGYGVGEYLPVSGWQILNGNEARALAIDDLGDVTAQFQGYGVGVDTPAAGWRLLTGANALRLSMDVLGAVFGAFTGYGIWEFEPSRGWFQIDTHDASLLTVA